MSSTMLVMVVRSEVMLVMSIVVAAVAATVGRLGQGSQAGAVRAAVQLAAVSLVITAVVVVLWATAGALLHAVASGWRTAGGA